MTMNIIIFLLGILLALIIWFSIAEDETDINNSDQTKINNE